MRTAIVITMLVGGALGQMRITVFDGDSSRIVREAEVYAIDYIAASASDSGEGNDYVEAWTRLGGRRLTAGKDGRFVLNANWRSIGLWARHGKLFAARAVMPQDEITLRLRRPVSFEVRVTDHEGKGAAGIPVVLRRPGRSAWLRTPTDAHGRVRFNNIVPQQLAPFEVAAQVTVAEPPSAPIDLSASPKAPIDLQLPPTVPIVVHLQDAKGKPFTDEVWGAIGRRPTEKVADGSMEALNRQLALHARAVVAKNGSITLRVGTGLDLELSLFQSQGRVVPVHREIRSAKTAGKPQRVDVTITRSAEVLGRLVDTKGKPVPGLTLSANLWDPALEPLRSRAYSRTDADGRFRFWFECDPARVKHRRIQLTHSQYFTPHVLDDREIADLKLPRSPASGPVDLGDVKQPERPLIVAGRVVDRAGRPVAKASVNVERFDRNRWSPELRTGGRTDDQGRFRIVGPLEGPGKIRLTVSAERHFLDRKVPCERGANDLTVAVENGGIVEGRVKCDPALADTLEIRVSGPPARNNHCFYWDQSDSVSDWVIGGSFAFRNLRSGVATVHVRFRSQQPRTEDILTIPDVKVEAGGVCADERVKLIDLTGRLHTKVFTLVSDDGTPLRNGTIWARDGGDEKSTWKQYTPGSAGHEITVSHAAERLDLVAIGAGHRVARPTSVTKGGRIVLRKARPIPVTIKLPKSVTLPAHPKYIHAELRWEHALHESEASAPEFRRPEARLNPKKPFDGSNEVVLDVIEPGYYNVQLWTFTRTPTGGGGSGLDSAPATLLRITEQTRDLVVEVVPDPFELKRFGK